MKRTCTALTVFLLVCVWILPSEFKMAAGESVENENIWKCKFRQGNPYGKNFSYTHTMVTSHFVIHYNISGLHAVLPGDADNNGVPDYVEKIADAAEQSFYVEINVLDFPVSPDPDRIDVYVFKLDPYMWQAQAYDIENTNNIYEPGENLAIDVDNDITNESTLKIMIAHEFFHCIQANYTWYENSDQPRGTCAARVELRSVIYPSDDAFVFGREWDANYNTGYLAIGASGDAGNRTWLKFDLSGIPSGAEIASAKLWLYFYGNYYGFGSPNGIAAHFSSDDNWEESTITWSNMPSINFTPSDVIPEFADVDTWKSWDLTSDMIRELGGDKKITLCLKANVDDEYGWPDGNNFARSKEYENSSYHPYLEITYS